MELEIDYEDDCDDYDCDDVDYDCDGEDGNDDDCEDDASVPMSSEEGHLVPMNTKAATTIQAVDKLTISGTF